MRHKQSSDHERDAAVERLREFLRFNYMTGSQAARRVPSLENFSRLKEFLKKRRRKP